MNWIKKLWRKVFPPVTPYKVGDDVYCEILNESGVVTAIEPESRTYPVEVKMSDGSYRTYTLDGQYLIGDSKHRLLISSLAND